jgi:hypothetical protein
MSMYQDIGKGYMFGYIRLGVAHRFWQLEGAGCYVTLGPGTARIRSTGAPGRSRPLALCQQARS